MNKENDWQRLTGPVPYKLTNDYLFRALLQENEEARKSIIAAVLGLRYEDIIKAEVTNPIELGKTIDSKTFFLDVKVEINNSSLVNLEMQVINEYNWPERSLGYLCRTYDNLNKGSDYLESKPAYQVSFLDFDLFENNKSLLSVYKLSNQKNPKEIYTDNFTISVVNLRRIENATEEDISSGLRDWAKLFKAGSWEEIKMIAAKNNFIESAVSSIHVMTQDEIFREQCELREARTRAEEIKKQRMEAMERELEELREAKEKAAKIEQQRMEAMEKEIKELREAKENAAKIEQQRKEAMEKELEELREAKENAAKIEQQRKKAMEKEIEELREAKENAAKIEQQRKEAMEKEIEELRKAKENAAKIEQQRMEAMEKEIEELREAKENAAKIEQQRKEAMEKEIEELREAKENAAKIEQQRMEAMEKEIEELRKAITRTEQETAQQKALIAEKDEIIAQLKKQIETT